MSIASRTRQVKRPTPEGKRPRLRGEASKRLPTLDLREYQKQLHGFSSANPIVKTKGAFGIKSHAEIVRDRANRAMARFAKNAKAKLKAKEGA